MRDNGIRIVRTRKLEAKTDGNHTFNIAPNLLEPLRCSGDFSADAPNQKCSLIDAAYRLSGNKRATFRISGPVTAGCS